MENGPATSSLAHHNTPSSDFLNMGHQKSPTQTLYVQGKSQNFQSKNKIIYHSCPFFDPFQLIDNFNQPRYSSSN